MADIGGEIHEKRRNHEIALLQGGKSAARTMNSHALEREKKVPENAQNQFRRGLWGKKAKNLNQNTRRGRKK